MIKRATLVWVVLAVLSGAGLFYVKYEVQALEERLAAVNNDILDNLEAVHVLKAEWAYLTRPARLEDLGRRLLDMEPVSPDQTGAIADLPFRVPNPGEVPGTSPGVPAEQDSTRPIARAPGAADGVMPLFARYRRTP